MEQEGPFFHLLPALISLGSHSTVPFHTMQEEAVDLWSLTIINCAHQSGPHEVKLHTHRGPWALCSPRVCHLASLHPTKSIVSVSAC